MAHLVSTHLMGSLCKSIPECEILFQIKFRAYGKKQGPMHGLPISTPYLAKDYLQQKRFQAQSAGTTYVYDYPDMFRQMVDSQWKQYMNERISGEHTRNSTTVVDCFVSLSAQNTSKAPIS
jgi:hypothetical protein